MKTLAILAGLAAASPLYAQPRPDYDRRTDESIHERDRERGWVDLTPNVEITSSRQYVPVASTHDISRLRIAASWGRPYIERIVVRRRGHKDQVYPVHRALNRPGDSVDIELTYGGSDIYQIAVFTPDQRRGRYSILGS